MRPKGFCVQLTLDFEEKAFLERQRTQVQQPIQPHANSLVLIDDDQRVAPLCARFWCARCWFDADADRRAKFGKATTRHYVSPLVPEARVGKWSRSSILRILVDKCHPWIRKVHVVEDISYVCDPQLGGSSPERHAQLMNRLTAWETLAEHSLE